MSGVQVNDYSIGDVNLTSMMETLDRQRRGYQAISLTHYDDNLECEIAAGSLVEVGGALFKFESNESITGWAGIGNNNDVYIKLVPSGTTITAAFVTAAPTWSTSKQGWYVDNDRYVGALYKDGSGNYTQKHLFRGLWQKFSLLNTGVKIADDFRGSAGDQVISGVGFKPSVVFFYAVNLTGANLNLSWGASNLTYNGSTYLAESPSKQGISFTKCIFIRTDISNYISAVVSSMDADGFTLTWFQAGTTSTKFLYMALP